MKRLFIFSVLLIATIASTVSTSAQNANPVETFVNKINLITQEMSGATSIEAIQATGSKVDEVCTEFNGSTYILTDSDRESITNVLTTFIITTAAKALPYQEPNASPEQIQAMEPMLRSQLSGLLTNSKTLGEATKLLNQ